LAGLIKRASAKQIRGMWISFHPQLVGEDAPEIISQLEQLIAALEFSVVSTTHDFAWASKASMMLPMAAWSEEKGTYTNFDGRVQISNRAVLPPGGAIPLHTMMSELLKLRGIQVSPDPQAIFEWMTRETPTYANLDYDAVGSLGIGIRQEVAQ
jgi:assimilatory nitrate reductase catalytic subunit